MCFVFSSDLSLVTQIFKNLYYFSTFQRVERENSVRISPESSPSPILRVLCPVSPHRAEPGGDRRLRQPTASVEAGHRRRERSAAAGV